MVSVENGVDWGRLGDCEDYFWTTPEERKLLLEEDENK